MRNRIVRGFRNFWGSERGLSIFLVLLLVNMFLVPPLISPGVLARVIFEAFFALLLLTGVASVSSSRWMRWVLGAAAIAAVGLRSVDRLLPSSGFDQAGAAATVLSAGLLALVVLAQVFRAGPVTVHRILGAVAAYLLFGLTWAAVYHLVNVLAPGAFAGAQMGSGVNASSYVYFSFVTLTTVGYGDVTPLHPVARSFAVLEALTGQLYPAILLARLVSLELLDRAR